MGIDDVPAPEELEDYRLGARAWLAANMPRIDDGATYHGQDNARLKELTRLLHSGGYSGICFPTELGGAGLSRHHHQAFCREAEAYELPWFVGIPGLGILAPVILSYGTDGQKGHITAMLEGREVFVQMMSEPSGGSNMAGALTRADRDGDGWVLNGSKIWSSGAHRADWGMLLARTNWEAPKHQGLSMFLLDLGLPGIEVRKIRMANGHEEFCQEFFEEVLVPHDCLLGKADDGWTVAQTLLFHERNATGGGSPYAYSVPRGLTSHGSASDVLVELARARGAVDDPHVLALLGEARVEQVVSRQLIERVTDAIGNGLLPPIASSMLRLNAGESLMRLSDIAFEIGGIDSVTWDTSRFADVADGFVVRQAASIGGGTTEMQRNVISERLLGMPRETIADSEKPFRDVRH
jgi:alkylation response protein AidB-like acyl-CoA dehydrogenase